MNIDFAPSYVNVENMLNLCPNNLYMNIIINSREIHIPETSKGNIHVMVQIMALSP